MNKKFAIGLIATAVWIAAIVGKHFWPDIDVGGISAAAQSVLTGLGVYHLNQPNSSPQTQKE